MSTDATITGGNNAPAVAGASVIPPAELDRLTDDIVTALKSVCRTLVADRKILTATRSGRG